MKFTFTLSGKTLYTIMRQAGYAPGFSKSSADNEFVFQRSITGSEFPKFHIYATTTDDTAALNLHLDQKKPTYKGTSAHGGEYDGPIIETEVSRILKTQKN